MYPNRLKILFVLIALLHLALVGRLAQLQLVQGGKYSGLSKKRLIKEHTLSARRGSIYDRHGRPLALEEASFDVEVRYKNLLYSYYASRSAKDASSDDRNELPPDLSKIKAHKRSNTACQECHPYDGLWVERVSRLLDLKPDELLARAEVAVKR
ncbi:MAG TPA: hypothetical protein ACFYEA_08875, partial [Candidatus Tripitaka californicus]